MEKITNVLSLFDGMSSGQIALNRIGIKYDNYYASEIDKYAIKVTQANYPNTIQLGSVTDVKAEQLPKIDLLIGGSPCQGFSFAGKGLNFEDPRSKLFFEYVRLLKECKPKYFLLENVKMKKEHEQVISEYLGCRPIRINSALVSAQNRQRLYWTNIPVVGIPEDKGIVLRDILEDEPSKKFTLSEAKIDRVLNTQRGRKKFINKDDIKSPTLIAGYYKQPTDGVYVDHPFKRMLTPLECELLQTVPIGYTSHVSNCHRYKMLGNGWTVDVIAFIFGFMPVHLE